MYMKTVPGLAVAFDSDGKESEAGHAHEHLKPRSAGTGWSMPFSTMPWRGFLYAGLRRFHQDSSASLSIPVRQGDSDNVWHHGTIRPHSLPPILPGRYLLFRLGLVRAVAHLREVLDMPCAMYRVWRASAQSSFSRFFSQLISSQRMRSVGKFRNTKLTVHKYHMTNIATIYFAQR